MGLINKIYNWIFSSKKKEPVQERTSPTGEEMTNAFLGKSGYYWIGKGPAYWVVLNRDYFTVPSFVPGHSKNKIGLIGAAPVYSKEGLPVYRFKDGKNLRILFKAIHLPFTTANTPGYICVDRSLVFKILYSSKKKGS